MLPFILAIPLLAVGIYAVIRIAVDAKKHGGRDYMEYFQENERKN